MGSSLPPAQCTCFGRDEHVQIAILRTREDTPKVACAGIARGECNAALAAGVNAMLSPETAIKICQLRVSCISDLTAAQKDMSLLSDDIRTDPLHPFQPHEADEILAPHE